MKTVILKSGKDKSALRKHPWIFSGAIKKIKDEHLKEVEPLVGEVVDVTDNKNTFLGRGFFAQGMIAVKILTHEPIDIDQNLITQKVASAYALRQTIGLTDNPETTCYRLIFAEGDGLPGIIVDWYDGVAVAQFYDIGAWQIHEMLITALKSEIPGLKAVYAKIVDHLKQDFNLENGYLIGEASVPHPVKENGATFWVDWETGQKTGFFLDQRDNRSLLAQYSKGRHVLNTFCYTGGFSVKAFEGGALSVDSVDASGKAVDLLMRNMEANNWSENHESIKSDTMEFLQQTEKVYDLIVLDPPAYAKHYSARHKAVQGYKRLNAVAMEKIAKGGILFTFSCSQVVDADLFYNTVVAAAISVGRNIRVLNKMGHAPDHPVSIYHPEGEYLKGLVLRVE